MPRFAKVFATILFAVVVAILAGNAFADGSEVTTGQFLVAVAKAHKLDVSDPANAADALRAAGYAIPKVVFDEPLTEGAVVSIAAALRFNLTTQTPDAAFTQTQMNVFLQSFGKEMATQGDPGGISNSNGVDPETKGMKKGHDKSKSEPL